MAYNHYSKHINQQFVEKQLKITTVVQYNFCYVLILCIILEVV